MNEQQGTMKDYYIRFGRKHPIPPTIQIKDEIGRMGLEKSVVPVPAQPQSPIQTQPRWAL